MCRNRSLLMALLGFFMVILTSCTEDREAANKVHETTEPENTAAIQQPAVPTANTGIVKSIQNAGGYSYIEVNINKQVFWMAASIISVKPGEKIAWNGYSMMKNFASKSLNRTFDQIMFVDKVMPAATMAASTHSGTLVETMNSGGYSYLKVEEQGEEIWLAVPALKIDIGQNIIWESGAPMQNFSSRALNRTFEQIFFVSGVQVKQS